MIEAILADEDLPASIVSALRVAGFEVIRMAADAGADDTTVLSHTAARGLSWCVSPGRALARSASEEVVELAA